MQPSPLKLATLLLALSISARASNGAAPPPATAPSTAPATTEAAGADLPPPTRVTLKFDHAPPADAVRQLLAQAQLQPGGVAAALDFPRQLSDVRVTADFRDQPFVPALLELCRQCYLEPMPTLAPGPRLILMLRRPGLSTRGATTAAATSQATTGPTTRPDRMRLAARFRGPFPPRGPGGATTRPSWLDGPAVTSGPFVFVAQHASRASRINLDADGEGGDAPQRELIVQFMVLRDPKLRLFALSDRVRVDEARDDAGHSLRPAPSDAGAEPDAAWKARRLWDTGRWILPATARLEYPPDESPQRTIALLRGRLNATIVARSEPAELIKDSAAVAGERTVGGLRLEVGKLEETPAGSRLALTVHRPASADDAAWEEIRSTAQADLITARTAGEGSEAVGRYTVHPQMHTGANNQSWEGTIEFHPAAIPGVPGGGPRPPKVPDHVVWDVPAELSDVAVPVEFRDLPLP